MTVHRIADHPRFRYAPRVERLAPPITDDQFAKLIAAGGAERILPPAPILTAAERAREERLQRIRDAANFAMTLPRDQVRALHWDLMSQRRQS